MPKKPQLGARAVIYTRISRDSLGLGRGVERQSEDCEALCRRNGWEVVQTYSDNDISAYSGRRRPGYAALLDLIESGDVQYVVAWHTDRLHRSLTELERYIDVSARAGVTTHTVKAGPLDLSNASGQMVAGLLGVVAKHESAQKSERIKRARQQEAQAGRSHGHLGYGYALNGERWEVVPEQAEVVREIASRLLAGDTLSAIARDLNSREVPTPNGLVGRWRSGNLAPMIASARYAGWREHTAGTLNERGRGRGFGTFAGEGDWPAILDRATTERLRVVLSDPGRKSERSRKHLLSGLLRCGKCGSPMTGQVARGIPRYACVSQPGLPERCGGTTITAKLVDEYVTAAFRSVISAPRRPARATAKPQDSAAVKELARVNDRIKTLAEDFADEKITRDEWNAMRQRLHERASDLEGQVRQVRVQAPMRGLPANPIKAWEAADLDRKRALLRAAIDHITVRPATPGVSPCDRLESPEWRV